MLFYGIHPVSSEVPQSIPIFEEDKLFMEGIKIVYQEGAGGDPISVPCCCIQKVSPKLNVLYIISSCRLSMIVFAGKYLEDASSIICRWCVISFRDLGV